MSHKKQYDNIGRKHLRRLIEVREKLYDLAHISQEINDDIGVVSEPKKMDELRYHLLNKILDTEINLKVSIFNFENPRLI